MDTLILLVLLAGVVWSWTALMRATARYDALPRSVQECRLCRGHGWIEYTAEDGDTAPVECHRCGPRSLMAGEEPEFYTGMDMEWRRIDHSKTIPIAVKPDTGYGVRVTKRYTWDPRKKLRWFTDLLA